MGTTGARGGAARGGGRPEWPGVRDLRGAAALAGARPGALLWLGSLWPMADCSSALISPTMAASLPGEGGEGRGCAGWGLRQCERERGCEGGVGVKVKARVWVGVGVRVRVRVQVRVRARGWGLGPGGGERSSPPTQPASFSVKGVVGKMSS